MPAMSDSPGEQDSEWQVPGNSHSFPFCAADSSYCVPELSPPSPNKLIRDRNIMKSVENYRKIPQKHKFKM